MPTRLPRRQAAGVLPTGPAQTSPRNRTRRYVIALALVPLIVFCAVTVVVAFAVIEMTMDRGLLSSDRGLLPPLDSAERFARFGRYVLIPVSAGLLTTLIVVLVMVRRVLRSLRGFSLATAALTVGDVRTLDLDSGGEVGDLNRALVGLYDEVEDSRRAERLFLLRVSHELRTPVAAIRGQAQALSDGLFVDLEDRLDAYNAIVAESDRLDRLVGDLMAIARLRVDSFDLAEDEINPSTLIAAAVRAVGVSAQRAGVTVHAVTVDPAPIVGDGDRLLQVIGNLLRNAVRWTPRGGVVEVRGLVDRDAFVVHVDDSGPGIPAERRERVFDMLYSESGTGSGIGLTIARDLARAMGGEIAIGDAPIGGARFTVRVPRAPGPQRSHVV